MTNPGIPNILTGTQLFMEAAGQLDTIGFPEDYHDNVRQLRRTLVDEEFCEFLDAEIDNDLVKVVDGLLDTIVTAWGTILKYVGPEKARAAADEVVRSNLSKIDGSLGPILRREDGKIQKPEGWTPPDIARVLA